MLVGKAAQRTKPRTFDKEVLGLFVQRPQNPGLAPVEQVDVAFGEIETLRRRRRRRGQGDALAPGDSIFQKLEGEFLACLRLFPARFDRRAGSPEESHL